MFTGGDQAKIKEECFSLLDIKNYLASHGFDATATSPSYSFRCQGAAIVLVKEQGYYHFVVVKACAMAGF